MNARILFVDDDIRVLSSFERVVHAYRKEWEVEFMSKSDQVIDYLLTHPTEVVVTDVKMPKVDGLELLKSIKTNPKLERVEVIVVTGLGERTLKQQALDLGAADLLNKPISNEELISRLRSVVRIRQFQNELLQKNWELQQQLIQIQKIEIIGLLAAGAVHDLNNILGIMKSYGKLMLKEARASEQSVEDLNVIMDSIDRAINITRQIHGFSRIDAEKKNKVDVGRLIETIRKSLIDLVAKNTEIVYNPPDEPILIEVPESPVFQVCMNLCINAIQAMEGGGRLSIMLYRDKDGETCIDFSDTGKGIDEATKERIFEPFFTTRRETGGSGMGLSIVRKIMLNMEGDVTVSNNPEGGANFRVRFPAKLSVFSP